MNGMVRWQDQLMTEPSDSEVDLMPTDPDLLAEIGRVTWAAARLHHGVRDAIGRHEGTATNAPFKTTLGGAIKQLERLATAAGRTDQMQWITALGRPATARRNGVVHAITATVEDKQALITPDGSAPERFLVPELRDVTLALVKAHQGLPQ
jgi:hypothetical protein